MPIPVACRPEAYQFFLAQLPQLETPAGLLRAAIAIAMHAVPDVPPRDVESAIDGLAARVRRRVHGQHRQALLAHLHDELFEVRGFRGNVNDYHNPGNSFLPVVLDTNCGIPISLALIYKSVAVRIGLRAEGVNAPGHFLVQVAGGGRPMLVDPFHQGKMLSREEAYDQIELITGRPVERTATSLPLASHRQWIARMLHNLLRIYAADGNDLELAAMTELAQALGAPTL